MSKRTRLDEDDLLYEAMMKADIPDASPGRCQRTGKIIWRKGSSAANAAKDMRAKHADPFIEHYRCQFCGFWHTGHAQGTGRLRSDLRHQKRN